MPSKAAHQGQIYLHRGNLPQARFWFAQAVQEARATDTQETLASALGNLGNVCALSGEHAEAEGCYREVLDSQRIHQDPNTIGETLVNLGNVKSDAG